MLVAVWTARPRESIRDVVNDWSARYRLSPAEREILVAAARGTTRDELRLARRVAPSTLKRQVFTLIRKTGGASLLHAVARLLREALGVRETRRRPRRAR